MIKRKRDRVPLSLNPKFLFRNMTTLLSNQDSDSGQFPLVFELSKTTLLSNLKI